MSAAKKKKRKKNAVYVLNIYALPPLKAMEYEKRKLKGYSFKVLCHNKWYYSVTISGIKGSGTYKYFQ